jgi:hypothetical protein
MLTLEDLVDRLIKRGRCVRDDGRCNARSGKPLIGAESARPLTGIVSLPSRNQFAAFETHLRKLVPIFTRRHSGMALEQVAEKPVR